MAKRKQPEADPEPEDTTADTPSKRQRKTTGEEELLPNGTHTNETPTKQATARRRTRTPTANAKALLNEEAEDAGSPTPKINGRTLFATPSKGKDQIETLTPSTSVKAKADRSAKRKSARLLAEAQNNVGEDVDFEAQDTRLAREILDEQEGDDEDAGQEEGHEQRFELLIDNDEPSTPSKQTPSKRTRKPRAPKPPVRSPTPEGDIPPEERYFYQNRSGPRQVSNNRFNSVKLLTHDEYYEQISSWKDPHESERAHLMKLHKRSFPQWKFELEQGFGLCLYGYGSKRALVTKFSEWLWKHCDPAPRIVVVNGYTPKLNLRTILNTLATTVADTDDEAIKLTGQPEEMLDTFLSHLNKNSPSAPLYVMINSVDGSSLRRAGTQSLLSRLSSHPSIHFLCTADTPTFPILWSSSLLDSFRFVYHDCTTFSPYEAELGNVVDEVHQLLGRKRTRAGGKEGVGFVLKSLPENARNLYRLLLTEILTLLDDTGIDTHRVHHSGDEEAEDAYPHTPSKRKSKFHSTPSKPAPSTSAEEIAIEYRTLYRKATEEFICSSSMNFQFLLKEFLDHQMITTRRDGASGAEMLGVPLERDEMEGVLGDLV